MKQRYYLLDEIRGITLCSMILYHAVWDLVYLWGRNWEWFGKDLAFIWQQSICYSFILLSGFCFSLGTKKFKRGLMVFGCGALISLVTELFMPQNRIRFGVLTLLGSCMLIVAVAERVHAFFSSKTSGAEIEATHTLPCIAPIVGITTNVFLFLITRRINQGVLGFADIVIARVPQTLYNTGDWGNFLGFTESRFFSTDYFSLFPWIFLFLVGYFVYKWMEKKQWLDALGNAPSLGIWWRGVGRFSLLIYLIHQPIIYGLLYLVA